MSVDTTLESGATTARPPNPRRHGAMAYGWAAVVVGAAAVLASVARSVLQIPDVEMLFLLAVTIVAVTATRGPSVFAAALSVAAYDFFFVAPAFTFGVDDGRYFLSFVMMLGIGLLISSLTVRIREQEQAAVAREQRAAALHYASRGFASALDETAVAAVCAGVATRVMAAPVVLLGRAKDDSVVPLAAIPPETILSEAESEVARWTFIQGRAAGAGAGPFATASIACWPVCAAVDVSAVLAIRLPSGSPIASEHRVFLEALCRQAALALERVRLAGEARAAAIRAEAEQLRSSLLSSVSHDLRTPLAAITGAATTLRDDDLLSDATRRELIGAICEEAERLERLVRNLLDMTRLESGAVQLRREWVPVEEVFVSALARLERALVGRQVTTSCPAEIPLLHVDPVLLEQLFINLLENAAKYTPPGSPIEITARLEEERVVVDVEDHGPGIPPGMEDAVFERFRRGAPGSVPGVGLGLAISRAIAQAHGGSLAAEPLGHGGARLRLVLPATDRPPPSDAQEGIP